MGLVGLVRGSVSGRLLVAGLSLATATGMLGCEETHCDASYPSVDLLVSDRTSIASFEATGDCHESGTSADCRLHLCTDGVTPCACDIFVGIKPSPGSPSTTASCHIEVTAVDGSVFAVDVEAVDSSRDCLSWSLSDPAQEQPIAVVFPTSPTDGGTGDAAP